MNSDSSPKPYCDYGLFLRQQYGAQLYRVPVDLGLGCPHRTPPSASDGCIYCGEFGSRAVHLREGMPLREQVQRGIQLARERYGATEFMAYFQASTSTNAPAGQLRELYQQVLDAAPFRTVIVSTRPDCLPSDTIEYLGELTQRYDVWVELGVQTANDDTLTSINRGHDFASSQWAARILSDRGIQVAAHVILGLPGESMADFRHTAEALRQTPFHGIKIHNLHIVRGTPLAEMWQAGQVEVWDEHEYADVLMDFLRHIPATWPVMRMVSDTPDGLLLAPKWWWGKAKFREYVARQMTQFGWRQGDLVPHEGAYGQLSEGGINQARRSSPTGTVEMKQPELDAVGSGPMARLGPRARALKALRSGGKGEELAAYADNCLASCCDLDRKLSEGDVTVLDIGFGLGTDVMQCIEGARDHRHRLSVVALGPDAGALDSFRMLFPEYGTLFDRLSIQRSVSCGWGKVSVHWGDARKHLFRVRGEAQVVVIEPAAPEEHPELFSVDFLRRVARLLAPDGIIVARTSAPTCRGALKRLGLYVGKCASQVTRCRGTVAVRRAELIEHALSKKEERIITQSISGVPFRDKDLLCTRKQILEHRREVVSRLRRRGWPKRVR